MGDGAGARHSYPENTVRMMHATFQALYLIEESEEGNRLAVLSLQKNLMVERRKNLAAREHVGLSLLHGHCLAPIDMQFSQLGSGGCRVLDRCEAQVELLRHHRLYPL